MFGDGGLSDFDVQQIQRALFPLCVTSRAKRQQGTRQEKVERKIWKQEGYSSQESSYFAKRRQNRQPLLRPAASVASWCKMSPDGKDLLSVVKTRLAFLATLRDLRMFQKLASNFSPAHACAVTEIVSKCTPVFSPTLHNTLRVCEICSHQHSPCPRSFGRIWQGEISSTARHTHVYFMVIAAVQMPRAMTDETHHLHTKMKMMMSLDTNTIKAKGNLHRMSCTISPHSKVQATNGHVLFVTSPPSANMCPRILCPM